MAHRKRIGLVYSYSESWIGGTYYILNIINSFKQLEDDKKPHLTIFFKNSTDLQTLEQVAYPYLSFLQINFTYNIIEKALNKIYRALFNKSLIIKSYPINTIDYVFPYDFQESLKNIPYKLCWIPDLQEYFLKDFFSKEEFEKRKIYHLKIIGSKLPIIFSSQTTGQDFQKVYTHAHNQTFIVKFAVSHPSYKELDKEKILDKFSIIKPYFICTNQFWIHKNHQVILEAFKHLKKEKTTLDFQIVFTGKEYDFRHPAYTQQLKDFVKSNSLEEDTRFLGFIDRKEQLKIMEHALAVIQPSLFEGWSTVVEDAKAMEQTIILSNLEVHQEQMRDYKAYFFDPHDSKALAGIIDGIYNDPPQTHISKSYNMEIKKFAESFLEVINKISSH